MAQPFESPQPRPSDSTFSSAQPTPLLVEDVPLDDCPGEEDLVTPLQPSAPLPPASGLGLDTGNKTEGRSYSGTTLHDIGENEDMEDDFSVNPSVEEVRAAEGDASERRVDLAASEVRTGYEHHQGAAPSALPWGRLTGSPVRFRSPLMSGTRLPFAHPSAYQSAGGSGLGLSLEKVSHDTEARQRQALEESSPFIEDKDLDEEEGHEPEGEWEDIDGVGVQRLAHATAARLSPMHNPPRIPGHAVAPATRTHHTTPTAVATALPLVSHSRLPMPASAPTLERSVSRGGFFPRPSASPKTPFRLVVPHSPYATLLPDHMGGTRTAVDTKSDMALSMAMLELEAMEEKLQRVTKGVRDLSVPIERARALEKRAELEEEGIVLVKTKSRPKLRRAATTWNEPDREWQVVSDIQQAEGAFEPSPFRRQTFSGFTSSRTATCVGFRHSSHCLALPLAPLPQLAEALEEAVGTSMSASPSLQVPEQTVPAADAAEGWVKVDAPAKTDVPQTVGPSNLCDNLPSLHAETPASLLPTAGVPNRSSTGIADKIASILGYTRQAYLPLQSPQPTVQEMLQDLLDRSGVVGVPGRRYEGVVEMFVK